MDRIMKKGTAAWLVAICVGIGALAVQTGCQVDVGGQTLPSPYYMQDDVQYFSPGTEFKLSREAAAIQQARAQQLQQGAGVQPQQGAVAQPQQGAQAQ